MKVLHIITGLNNGGAEGVLYRLVTHDKSNHHIVISLMDEGKYGHLLIDKGINVHCLNMSQGKPSIKSIVQLYKLVKKANPDIVQTWMYHADLIGGVIAKSVGVKKIFWNIRHSTFDSRFTKSSTIKVAKLCARLSRIVPSAIVSCSHVAIQPHVELGYDKYKINVISNGYDLNLFKIDNHAKFNIRNKLNIGNKPVLGMVGRYDPQKNHEGLIRSLGIVAKLGYDFDLLLVGKGLDKDNQQLLSLIKKNDLQDKVHLLGQRKDIPSIMNALDIHILSSSYGEGFPNVIAEAMACGTPCIATNIGDSAFIIDNLGSIVNANDSNELAISIIEKLDILNNDKEAWSLLCLQCMKHIKANFGLDSMVRAYNTLWSKNY